MNNNTEALSIVKTLVDAGYIAYYAGGCVRDFLLGHDFDDIDIATSALPDDIMKIFPHTIGVGAHFGVVVVVVEGRQYEVATFRSEGGYTDGRRPQHITATTPEEDVKRRDFTINGMFYDPIKKEVYDFVGGKEDLEKKVLRAIGDPQKRFEEDRLRMLRAVRFSCRLGYDIEESTYKAIQEYSHTVLPAVSMERIWQEFSKMIKDEHFGDAVMMMYDTGLLKAVFPSLEATTKEALEENVKGFTLFSDKVPAVLYVATLFLQKPLEDTLEQCKLLKMSKKERSFVETLYHARDLSDDENTENVSWVRLYADDNTEACLEVLAAYYHEEERSEFLKDYRRKRRLMSSAIERIKNKTPIVTSAILQEHGIVPGKEMGDILREAERIAVNEMLDDANDIIKLLQKSPIWPQR